MFVDSPREFRDGLGQCRVRLDQLSELIGVVEGMNRDFTTDGIRPFRRDQQNCSLHAGKHRQK